MAGEHEGIAWRAASEEPSHPLNALSGRPLGEATLLAHLGPASRAGARYFQLLLQDARGDVTHPSLLLGLHHQGPYPAHNWIEVISTHVPPQAEVALFRCLAELLPPGGHLLVEYESEERCETERALALGVPPVLAPLGYLLLQAGCGAGFKDWCISEGGSEGPRKLQGFKALDREHQRSKAGELLHEVEAFLSRAQQPGAPHREIRQAARERAQEVMRLLRRDLSSS